jgi:hypothetical protein
MGTSKEGSLIATLSFILSDQTEETYSRSFTLSHTPTRSGPELLTRQLFDEVGKELRFGAHWDALASVEDLSQCALCVISPDDFETGKEFSLHNTREVWREITNTLLSVKFLLAEARAFKDVRLEMEKTGADENGIVNVHLNMIKSFDHAVYLLAKVENLFLLLLFVNLWSTSTSIVKVDVSSPDWDRAIDWKSVNEGLLDRSRLPADVNDAEHNAILRVLNRYQRTGSLKRIADYRNRVAHTLHPSVDDPKFSASLCFPKQIQAGVDMSITWPSRAEFQFLELYKDAADAFMRVATLLHELKKIQRFA